MARRGGRVQPFKACKSCGTLVARDASVCPECGSADFTDNWSGMLIVIYPEDSQLARELGIDRRATKAVMIAKRVVL